MLNVPAIILISSAFLYLVRKYRERCWGRCKDDQVQTGRSQLVTIITGAGSGIGYQLAAELSRRGYYVILTCRTMDKAETAANLIRQKIPETVKIRSMALDVGNLQSIKTFCEEISSDYKTVNILINNAGCSYPNDDRHETDDGLEIHFGVNYLGHFYLTTYLLKLDMLKEGSRVITVASSLFEKGVLDLEDLNNRKGDKRTNLYASSKLACVYFSRELAKRTKERGVLVYTVCPGWVYTNLFRHSSLKWYQYALALPVAFLFMRTPWQGCQTVLDCAVNGDLLESGYIYKDCKRYKPKMKFDDQIGARLWDKSVAIVDGIVKKD